MADTFNPYQYSCDKKVSYLEKLDCEKPVSEMTLKEALIIVCGQARESDFYNDIVERACQMVERDLLKKENKDV